MNGLPLGLIVESSVAILLVVTIVYSIALNQRLKRLHADRETLKQMVGDLVQATTLANSAIKGLKEAALEADTMLNSRLQEADGFVQELSGQVSAGRSVLDRIVRVTDAARQRQIVEAQPEHRQGSAARNTSPNDQLNETQEEARGAQAALNRLIAHRRSRENAA